MELNEQTATFSKRASIPAKALLATYNVAYHVAKCKKKNHTIAEEHILPSAVDMGVCCKTTFECAFVQQHYYPSNL
jgi:hypothetical protein